MLAAGVVAGVMLVVGAGYPASAVGVPGDARSNLNPPSLFAVALAVAQIGAFLLIRAGYQARRGRVGRRPADTGNHVSGTSAPAHDAVRADEAEAVPTDESEGGKGERVGGRAAGRLVDAINRAALPIYLGHQSVLIAVTTAVAPVSPTASGLLTPPDGPGWLVHRLAWLPVFAVLLAAVLAGIAAVTRAAAKTGTRHR